MSRFIGNCEVIDWNALLEQISNQQGEARTYGQKFYQNNDGRFDQIIQLWKTAGYEDAGTVEWINYYPSKHFDQNIVQQFETFTNVRAIKCWISKINPGRYAPYHWDVDDKEESYLQMGNLVRYSTHIGKPLPGQVFILDQEVHHMEAQGNTYQWNSYKDWHAGGNCSFRPKYLFNFLGITP